MKIGIIIGVLAGIAVAAVAVIVILVLGLLPVSNTVSVSPDPTGGPAPVADVIPAPSPEFEDPEETPEPAGKPAPAASPSPTPSPSKTTSPTPTKTASPTPSPSPSPKADVVFSVFVKEYSTSGLTATVEAQLTNEGTTTAHNTVARVEVFTGGSRIKISGQDYLDKEIGIVSAGAIKTARITMTFSITDAAKVMANGANVRLTVTSDEKKQVFNYDY